MYISPTPPAVYEASVLLPQQDYAPYNSVATSDTTWRDTSKVASLRYRYCDLTFVLPVVRHYGHMLEKDGTL